MKASDITKLEWHDIKDRLPPDRFDLQVITIIPTTCTCCIVPSGLARIDAIRLLKATKEYLESTSWDRKFSMWAIITLPDKYVVRLDALRKSANRRFTKQIEDEYKGNISKTKTKYLDNFWDKNKDNKNKVIKNKKRRKDE